MKIPPPACRGRGLREVRSGRTVVLRTGTGAPRFDAAIAASDRDQFEPPLEVRYFGQNVCVTGTVLAVPLGYRIWVGRPDQILESS